MSEQQYEKCPIAIVGMSCRLPGANDPDELWSMLIEGRDALRSFEERWKATLIHPRKQELKPPVPRAGLLDSIDGFDAAFFGISPREAARMDPQQRILLELVWEALEDAGIRPEECAGERVGVFVACSSADYWSMMLDSANRGEIDGWTNLGGSLSILSSRISHAFDLRGPSFTIDTACSSSLYATHLAKESLLRGECSMALVAGANLLLNPGVTLGFSRAQMLSPTGSIRPFGEGASGYVRGEGCGCVVLKRLDASALDRDRIYAVIRGSAVSQDGHTPGITVPSSEAQRQMLELAYSDAGIDPASVRYVEAHGTGTPVGDPLEAQALGGVLGAGRPAAFPCLIGSIKSNIGHLEASAGIAGLIKAALCLHNDTIVPSLSSETPNPEIPFETLGLRVAHTVEPLRTSADGCAAVGVNSFSFGGTNVHVVLAGSPLDPSCLIHAPRDSRAQLVPISARHERGVHESAERLIATLKTGDLPLSDVAYTACERREAHPFRAAAVAATTQDLMVQLESLVANDQAPVRASADAGALAFVFTGMGPQWWGMGRTLMRDEPLVRACVEKVDRLFEKLSGWSLIERVFAAAPEGIPSLVDRADIGHPAHFALQMGIVDLLRSWGIRPTAVTGHSAGEVSAVCASGMLSLEDSIKVLYHRSRLVQRAAGQGNMLAAQLSLAEARQVVSRYAGAVCIAAINAPSSVSFSGERQALLKIAEELEQDGRFARIIPGDLPYHSPAFEPIREELIGSLGDIVPMQAEIPLVSTVTGTWLAVGDLGHGYWWDNVRNCVLFERAVGTLLTEGYTSFVEIGAHPALLRSISDTATAHATPAACLASLRRDVDERTALLGVAAELWKAGHAVELASTTDPGTKLASLPTYPWDRKRYWIEASARVARTESSSHPVLGERAAADRPTWQAQVSSSSPRWANDHRLGDQVLLPGVAWVDAWLCAALDEGASFPIGLEEIRFLEVRVVGEEPVWLRTRRLGERWTIESAEQLGGQAWTLHASARRDSTPLAAPSVDLERVRQVLSADVLDYDVLERNGMRFGPSFRSVEGRYCAPGRTLSRLRLAESALDDGDHLIHPGLLDGAMHGILAAPELLPGAYVLARIDRVAAYGRCSMEEARELWASIEFRRVEPTRAIANVAIVDAAGRALLRADGVHVERASASADRQTFYRERWIRVGSAEAESRLSRATPRHPLDQLWQGVGELTAPMATHTLDALLEALGTGDGIEPLEARISLEHPELHLERQLLSRLLRQPQQASADEELLASFHADSETWRPAHRLLRSALMREIDRLGTRRSTRIVEIGGRWCGSAVWLLPELDPDRTEYLFTDPSLRTVTSAVERLQRYPFARAQQLDLLGSEPSSISRPASADVVVLTLHASDSDVQRMLTASRELLRPDGLLLAIDARPSIPALRSLLALVDGSDRASDGALVESWRALLLVSGFVDATEAVAGPLRVLAARAPTALRAPELPELPRDERWFVIGSGALADSLVDEVGARGGCVQLSPWGNAGEQVVPPVAERVIALLPDATDSSRAPKALLQLVHALRGSPQLSILTRGCQSLRADCAPRNLTHAAAWGLARVIANEHPELRLRLIDLGPDRADDQASDVIDEIARIPASEPADHLEVALRGALRFAPQLLRYSLQERGDEVSSDPAPGRWVVAVERPGDLASLRLRRVERRAPGRDEIEIAVDAHAVNFRDSLLALGMLDRGVGSSSHPPGSDAVGTIVRIGEGVEELQVGQKVVGIAPGWFSSFVTVPAALFVPLPSKLSAIEAVTLPLVGATVEFALCEAAHLEAGETVLVHSGAGGLGLAAIRLAQHIGAQVYATAGTEEKRDWLRSLGVERVFDSRTLDFHREILDATGGRGIDVVLNSLSGEALDRGIDLLAAGGRFVELGKRDAYSDRPVGLRNLLRNASVHVVDLDELAARAPALVGRALRRMFRRCEMLGWRGLPYVRMPASRFAEALRWMASGRLTGKLVVDIAGASVATASATADAPALRGDALYLITGGLSGFGLATARWLAARGASHIALVSRGAPGEEAMRAISELRASGVQITTVAADVSHLPAVEHMLSQLAVDLPPLRGVFHAAAVYEDATVANTSEASFDRVFAPKAVGAWNLHQATRRLPLDLFVLFSSIGRTYGATGQASYVAANEFLSALCGQRRASGLTALCIDWGAIGDVGYLSRNPQVRARLADIGATPLEASEALDLMAEVLFAGQTTLGIARVDWSVLVDSLPAQRIDSKLATLKQANPSREAKPESDEGAFQAALAESDPARSEALALAFVRSRAAKVLRAAASALDSEVPLVELGFDSLMEVELRAVLQRDTGTTSASRRVLRGSSLRSIGRSLLEQAGAGSAGLPAVLPKAYLDWLAERERVLNDYQSRLDASELTRELAATLEGLRAHVDHLGEADHVAHRAELRRRIARFFLLSPLLQRALAKPLGYAGDFEIMNHIYGNAARGSGLERAVDELALSRPAAQANRNRVPFLVARIGELAEKHGRLRIASVGCGPAREIRALANDSPGLLQKLDILLLDQDERALEDCRRALEETGVPGAAVELVRASVEELTEPGSRADLLLGQRDFIYSAGLFDYFNDQNFERYLRAMYGHLAPGGQIVIGNISSESPDRWLLEYVTDWFLYHRSVADLQKYRELLTPPPSFYSVESEETGINLFLVARSPRD
jgi:phthiocerol/phenolphthiocerol synthesis type-I polyketide synthase C